MDIYNVLTSSDEDEVRPRPVPSIFRDMPVDHRPSAPRRREIWRYWRYKSSRKIANSQTLIQLDLFTQFLFLKLRLILRHFTILCLTFRTRPAQLLMSDFDKNCVRDILTKDSSILTAYILGISPPSCSSKCDKVVCCCASYLDALDFKKIISIGKNLLTKALQLEQYLDLRSQNMTARNQFLCVHPRRPQHFNSDSDKYDYDIIDTLKIDSQSPERHYKLSDGDSRPANIRVTEFKSRPKNYRKSCNVENHFLLYQHIVCALSKLARVTAHVNLGCFCTVFEENHLKNGFRYQRDYMRCCNNSNYSSIGVDARDRFNVLELHSDECCCQGVSPLIMCLNENCCVTLPSYVERPINDQSSFSENWYILEKVYRYSRPRNSNNRTPNKLRPVLRTEVRWWFINYLLNRSQLDWSDSRTDNLADPFVMRGNIPQDLSQAEDGAAAAASLFPRFRSPKNNLDRFYNKIFTLNPSLVLLLYLQTLVQLKPWSEDTRRIEEQRTMLGLDVLASGAKRKFPYCKYGRPTDADGLEHQLIEPPASDSRSDDESEDPPSPTDQPNNSRGNSTVGRRRRRRRSSNSSNSSTYTSN